MRQIELARVYPITSSEKVGGFNHLELVQHFLQAGARFFQVREKRLPDSALYEELLQIKAKCRSAQAQFLVNDRTDLALASGADGVHLGQTDLPVEAARRLFGQDAIIGLSTHNLHQFKQAQQYNLDYVAVGPIFHTLSKQSEYEPLGVDFVRSLPKTRRHPVVAIGGITLENAKDLWKAGADSVAIISDIGHFEDPCARIRQYLALAREFDR